MNRTIKDATVKRYHYETHDQFGSMVALVPSSTRTYAAAPSH